MNHTTNEYLEQLQQDREDFVDNLETKGITGLTGNETFTELVPEVLNISSGATNIYRVASIAERDALTNINEDDMCVVYTSSIGDWQSGTEASVITFPETVSPDGLQASGTVYDSNNNYIGSYDLTFDSFYLNAYSDTFHLSVNYTSYDDGATFTRESLEATDEATGTSLVDGNTVTLPSSINFGSSFSTNISKFMQVSITTFGGLFSYKNSSWSYTDIGLNENGSNYLTSSKGYTNSGITQGSFPQGTKRDLNFLVNNRVGSFTIDTGYCLFQNNTNLKELGFTLNTSNVTDMTSMFYGCTNLKELDLSNFNTSNVTDMSGMFRSCSSLISLDISNFDVSNLKSTINMFETCSNLESLNLGNFTTNTLYSTSAMFGSCSKLIELNLSGLGTINLSSYKSADYSVMFSGCSSLKRVDLSNLAFNKDSTSNVNLRNLFYNCKALEYIDIRNLDFTAVTNYQNLFGGSASYGVPNNCLIIVKDTTQKSWVNTKFSRLTNVKTVEEYEASLNS